MMPENLTLLHAKNKAANQPAHLCSLVWPFAIPSMDCKVVNLVQFRISKFWLLSVAEQAGLSITWSD